MNWKLAAIWTAALLGAFAGGFGVARLTDTGARPVSTASAPDIVASA
jgi:hypothetical protein